MNNDKYIYENPPRNVCYLLNNLIYHEWPGAHADTVGRDSRRWLCINISI